MSLDLSAQDLWIPGQGLVPAYVRQAMTAVEEYDRDLTIGRHEQTGEWVILLKRGPEGRPFPVFGLGPELPAPEALKQRLYEGDVRRHGGELAVKLERAAERRRQAARDHASDAAEEAARGILWAARKEGKAHIPQVFVSRGVKK